MGSELPSRKHLLTLYIVDEKKDSAYLTPLTSSCGTCYRLSLGMYTLNSFINTYIHESCSPSPSPSPPLPSTHNSIQPPASKHHTEHTHSSTEPHSRNPSHSPAD